ncbi:MAG: TonB-dependent receptor [Bacteroidales bacterium]|nr:TonB-dependent receptor [Bacteroidales bacterium]
MNIFAAICLSCAIAAGPGEGDRTDTLSASVVTVSKLNAVLEMASAPVVSISGREVQQRSLSSPKTLSSLIPNLHIPEYGSAMTSTIYARGLGSRMENPSIGLYVDEIPVLDKNMFDTDFLDVERVDYVSGPQGTLFGRNAMVGVLSVTTKNPSAFETGSAHLSFGSGGTFDAAALWQSETLVFSARAFHTNGLYTNTYNDNKIDGGSGLSFRLKYRPYRGAGRSSDYSLWVSYLDQGGWPYRLYDGGDVAPVAYNDNCNYRRLSVLAGAAEGFKVGLHDLKSVFSLQLLGDKMNLDQDFTSARMFTLEQRQRQIAVTEELIFRPSIDVDWWDSQSGLFLFGKYNRMHAPVHFFEDGIENLILGNANAHIPQSIGYLDFQEDDFVIGSDFDLFYQNAAIYHESWFTFGKWRFTAGLRADFEYQHMKYDSNSLIHFALLPRMTEFRELPSVYKGNTHNSWLQIVPKVAVRYGDERDYVFASASKGFRAGGFNTQIFSDILQGQMTSDLMNSMGVHVDGMGESQNVKTTAYKPEESWNFEVGGRTSLTSGSHLFVLSASVFDIECRNQQITVFPPGKNTGRMMANAGRSRSYGAELSASWLWNSWRADLRGGYSHAAFVRYDDNQNDYSGNCIPYVPSATWHAALGRRFDVDCGSFEGVDLTLSASGCGKIWWNEENSLSQPAYCLLGADVTLLFYKFDIFAHFSNLTDKDYSVFCFKSVGNTFLQKGRPRCFNAGIRIKF